MVLSGLTCEVTYTIIAGGTLNGDLVGPRSSYEPITIGPCPNTTISPTGTYVTLSPNT